MHASPLRLEFYFISEQRFSTNRRFDPQKPLDLDFDDMAVTHSCARDQDNARKWQVTLTLTFKPGPKKNVPYHFSSEIVGLFDVKEGCTAEHAQLLATTNGPSVLFGALRESLRSLMAQGPFQPLLLPTASFYETPKPGAQAPADSAHPEAKKDPAGQ